jgi:hypothetical protein
VSDRFATNSLGTPYIASMFEQTIARYDAEFYGYVNGDILFTEEVVTTMKAVSAAIQRGEVDRRVLVFGRRFNVNMTEDVADLEQESTPLVLPATTAADLRR